MMQTLRNLEARVFARVRKARVGKAEVSKGRLSKVEVSEGRTPSRLATITLRLLLLTLAASVLAAILPTVSALSCA